MKEFHPHPHKHKFDESALGEWKPPLNSQPLEYKPLKLVKYANIYGGGDRKKKLSPKTRDVLMCLAFLGLIGAHYYLEPKCPMTIVWFVLWTPLFLYLFLTKRKI